MRIFVSAMAGVLFTCMMLAPFVIIYELSHGLISVEAAIRKLPQMLFALLAGVVYFPLAFVIASPLILISMLVGIVFKDEIERELKLWCYLSAILVWLVVCVISTQLADDRYLSRGFIDGFFTTLTRIDSLAYLLGPAFSSLIFYRMSTPKIHSADAEDKAVSTLPEPRHQHDQQGQEFDTPEQHGEGHHPDR